MAACWYGVVQKQREIGILRATGAGRLRIMTVFLLHGRLVGLPGSIFGSALTFGLLVVFPHVFKVPDGSPLFSAQLMIRCWCCWRRWSLAASGWRRQFRRGARRA